MHQPHHHDEAGDGHAQPSSPFPADSWPGEPVLDVERHGRERCQHVQPVAGLADSRVANLEAPQPHQHQPRDEDHERDKKQRQPEPDGRLVRSLPRGRQVHETENQKGHDQEKTEDQMKSNHQHIERRLLCGSPQPGQRGDAREVGAVGEEHREADQDDPEKRAQPRADGRCVNSAAPVAHRSSRYTHDQSPPT